VLAATAALALLAAVPAEGKRAVHVKAGRYSGGGVSFRVKGSTVSGLKVRTRMFCVDGSSYTDTFTERKGDKIRLKRGAFRYSVHDGPVSFVISARWTKPKTAGGRYSYATSDSVNDCNSGPPKTFTAKRR
jgi:hypothetical protein